MDDEAMEGCLRDESGQSSSSVAGPSMQKPQRLVRMTSIDAESAIEDLLLDCLREDFDLSDFADNYDTDRDPNFEPESNHNSDTEQDMSDNEDENIILPCNSNNMTIEIQVCTNGFEDGNDVQIFDRNAS